MSAGKAWLTADFRKGKVEVLAAMISARKAAKTYLDMALSQLEQVESEKRSFLSYQLSRALANNVLAGVRYLRGTSDADRKLRIAASLAAGLARYPIRAEEFVENLSATPADYQGTLLAGCIRSQMYGAILDCVVEGWLAQNYKKERDYAHVLSELKNHPVRWHDLLERKNLSAEIIADFNMQADSVSVKAEANVNMPRTGGAQKQSRNNQKRRTKRSSLPESDLQ